MPVNPVKSGGIVKKGVQEHSTRAGLDTYLARFKMCDWSGVLGAAVLLDTCVLNREIVT